MNTKAVEVRDPSSGALIGVCPGPTAQGTCPFARRDGVVACSGLLIQPSVGDPRYWPVRVPRGYRHCEFGWHEQADSCLARAESCRRRWRAGLARETARISGLAAAHDPRYRKMTSRQVEKTAWWYWRLSPNAERLAHSETKYRERALLYLRFAEARRRFAQPATACAVE